MPLRFLISTHRKGIHNILDINHLQRVTFNSIRMHPLSVMTPTMEVRCLISGMRTIGSILLQEEEIPGDVDGEEVVAELPKYSRYNPYCPYSSNLFSPQLTQYCLPRGRNINVPDATSLDTRSTGADPSRL